MSITTTAPEEGPHHCCGILCSPGAPAFQLIPRGSRGQAVPLCSVHSVFLTRAEAILITEEIPGNSFQVWSLDVSKLWAWTKKISQHPIGASSSKAEAEKAKSLFQTVHPHMPEPTALAPWDPPKHSQVTRRMKLSSGALSSVPLKELPPCLFTPWTEGSSFLLLPAQLLWKCSAFPLSHPTMAAPFISVRHSWNGADLQRFSCSLLRALEMLSACSGFSHPSWDGARLSIQALPELWITCSGSHIQGGTALLLFQ